MDDDPVSPAVISLLNEQAEQTAKRKTWLDKGLEDTFSRIRPGFRDAHRYCDRFDNGGGRAPRK